MGGWVSALLARSGKSLQARQGLLFLLLRQVPKPQEFRSIVAGLLVALLSAERSYILLRVAGFNCDLIFVHSTGKCPCLW
jgi:hypothetical protein